MRGRPAVVNPCLSGNPTARELEPAPYVQSCGGGGGGGGFAAALPSFAQTQSKVDECRLVGAEGPVMRGRVLDSLAYQAHDAARKLVMFRRRLAIGAHRAVMQ